MSERIYVKPGFQLDHQRQPTEKLLHLPDPKTGKAVPDFGAAVELDTYWVRRLECKDAVKITEKEFTEGREAAQKKKLEERKKLAEEKAAAKEKEEAAAKAAGSQPVAPQVPPGNPAPQVAEKGSK